jgi:uncharacterized protein
MAFVFNPENRKTILTIDGGGMRGIIPLTMLIYLEEQLNKPTYEIFNMVAGTSTGAIIAAGLGLGYSARQILEIVYRDKLPNAFGKRDLPFWLRFVFKHKLRYLYPWEPFLEAMRPLVQGHKVSDLTKTIVLMTTRDLRTTNTYYIVNAGPGAGMFASYPLAGAVAASGAVPVYFPPVVGNLVDGAAGVFGNPCLAAAIEAVDYIGFDAANTLLVSLGTGFSTADVSDGDGSKFGILRWIQYYIAGSMIENAVQQSYSTRAIYGSRGMDFRRYNVNLTMKVAKEVLGIEAVPIDPASLSLESTSPQEIALMESIGYRYAAYLDWSKPNQMPWDTSAGQPQPRIESANWNGSIFEA